MNLRLELHGTQLKVFLDDWSGDPAELKTLCGSVNALPALLREHEAAMQYQALVDDTIDDANMPPSEWLKVWAGWKQAHVKAKAKMKTVSNE